MSSTDHITVLLASASPARLATLRSAGIEPVVQVSHVDEEALEAAHPHATPAEIAQLLAQAKCEEVAKDHTTPGQVIIGCDSVSEIGGQPFGKPGTPEVARERWGLMMNQTGTLHTGHYLIYCDERGGEHRVSATASTHVTLGELSEHEMQAYLDSGEPLQVAGGFTLDSLGGAFVQSITGDPSNVVGISLPTVRRLVTELGLRWTDLWNRAP